MDVAILMKNANSSLDVQPTWVLPMKHANPFLLSVPPIISSVSIQKYVKIILPKLNVLSI